MKAAGPDFRHAISKAAVALTLLCVVAAFALMAFSMPTSEADHVRAECKGEIEYRLDDGRRVDCLTETHATEFEWSEKWAEGIGQALGYGLSTKRRPGLVLIPRGSACTHLGHVLDVVAAYGLPIDVWMQGRGAC